MRCLFVFLCIFIVTTVHAQSNVIFGRVVHELTREPVSGASVFISNSTRGTVTKADGSFELTDVPTGNHDLVVSSIGYLTLVFSYGTADLPLKLEVQLQRKVSQLDTVVVEPDEVNGWEKWGRFFVDNFIGTSENAQDCKLLNPKALRFKNSRKNGTLTVIADEPLIIENKALGYTIQYQLEEFAFDFNSKYLFFLGYPLFQDMNGGNKQQRRWASHRVTAYNGSVQHFLKALYDNQLAAAGYEVRRLVKQQNAEKLRVKALYKERMRAKGEIITSGFGDSTNYYSKVLRQKDEFDIVSPSMLTADSLLTQTGGVDKTLFFENYLFITYKNEREEERYVNSFLERRAPYYQTSTIFLPTLTPIIIDKMGNYAPVLGIMSYGYWSWSEKIANMLPSDYEPGK